MKNYQDQFESGLRENVINSMDQAGERMKQASKDRANEGMHFAAGKIIQGVESTQTKARERINDFM